LWTFVDAPVQAVAILRERVLPVAKVDERRIRELVLALESQKWAAREQAQTELESLGELAVPQLIQAVKAGTPAEVRSRIENILVRVDTPINSSTAFRALRSVQVLEHIGTAGALQVLESLSSGVPEARLTRKAKAALGRLNGRISN
jgi:hypothetical protein